MKNIEAILAELGIEIPEDKLADLKKMHSENYKTVADYDKQKEKVDELSAELKSTKEKLEGLEGIDSEAMTQEIAGLKQSLADKEESLRQKDAEYAAKLADRDFTDSVEKAIRAKSGKNAKAIMALLDIETLRASKNQQADIEKALDDLTQAEDSKMLFGTTENVGSGNPIGSVNKGTGQDTLTMNSAIAGHYSQK